MKESSLPRIAVLMAAYNGIEWIEQQIESILLQDDVDVTIYVSVDRSHDGTESLVEKLSNSDKRVVLMPYGQRFGSAASNFFHVIRSVDYATYDYVALSDQDDIWLSSKLAVAVRELKMSGAVAYSSDVRAFWPSGRELLLRKSYPQVRYDHFFESPGPGCTFVFDRSVVIQFCRDFSSFSDKAAKLTTNHDWFLYAYVRSNDYKWHISDQAKMLYRQHDENQVGMNKGIGAYIARINLVRSKWYRRQVDLIISSFRPEFNSIYLNRKWLLSHFYNLRRRPRDKIVMLFFVLFGLF